MDKFKNKYRISSTRLQSWDYGSNGSYFITICTKNRKHFFGKIVSQTGIYTTNVMELNDIGCIAEKYWMEIPKHFSFVELGNFVIMPNHMHGILIINKSTVDPPDPPVDMPNLGISTGGSGSTGGSTNKKNGGRNPKWKPGTIGVIVNQYKRIVTIKARKIAPYFGWQSLFHDSIIWDNASFNRVQNYIANNPASWNKDKFNG